MKGLRPLLFALAVALLVPGRGVNFGKSTTSSRNVSGFTSVELDSSGRLEIEQTGTESLSITADDNLLPYLTSDVSGGRLRLGTKERTSFNGSVVYKLTVKSLSGIEALGSGPVNAKGLTSDSMKIGIRGSGSVTAAGRANRLEVAIQGSGSFHGDDFKSKDARVVINGSGGASVAASDMLDVTINGSGSVKYIGDPKVTTTRHGSGSVGKKR